MRGVVFPGDRNGSYVDVPDSRPARRDRRDEGVGHVWHWFAKLSPSGTSP